jgi:hypothetical protein
VAEALRGARGIQRYAAIKLGCHRQTVANMLKRHPELAQIVDQEREGLLDTAEGKLAEAIGRGEMTAILFFLKCQGKGRGYVERRELTGKDGAQLVEWRRLAGQFLGCSEEEVPDL